MLPHPVFSRGYATDEKSIKNNNIVSEVTARSKYTDWDRYNQSQIDSWIQDDMKNANDTTRYIYLDEDIYKNKENRNLARVCLSKAINSVALSNPKLIHPRDVSDNHGVVLLGRLVRGTALLHWSSILGGAAAC